MNRYTLMTYEQWQHCFKTALKRTIKQKFIQTLQILVLTIIFLMPVWMFLDWLLRGY